METRRGLNDRKARGVLCSQRMHLQYYYYQSPDCRRKTGLRSGKKHLITPCDTSLSSCTGKWCWGFTWQNEHNPTDTLRSESLIRTFSFSSLACLSFNWFWQRSSLFLKQTAITEASEIQKRERQELKKVERIAATAEVLSSEEHRTLILLGWDPCCCLPILPCSNFNSLLV